MTIQAIQSPSRIQTAQLLRYNDGNTVAQQAQPQLQPINIHVNDKPLSQAIKAINTVLATIGATALSTLVALILMGKGLKIKPINPKEVKTPEVKPETTPEQPPANGPA